MNKPITRQLSLIATLILAMTLTACSSSSDTSSGSGPNGVLAVSLTDAPSDELSSVVVAITGLKIKKSGSPSERSIMDEVKKIDLLTLENAQQLLVETSVEAGTYEYIMFELDQAQSHVVENGAQKPVQIPSQKIKALGTFEVQEGRQTNLLYDFNVDQSMVRQGNNNWLMKPVIIKK